MLKIKIIVYAFLVSSFLTFACASNAAKGSAEKFADNLIQTGEAKDLTGANPSGASATQKDAGAVKFKGLIVAAAFEMTQRRNGRKYGHRAGYVGGRRDAESR